MNRDRPGTLTDLKLFIKKFWALFIIIMALVAGVKEVRRLLAPDSYTYEVKLTAVPKSLVNVSREALEKSVWVGSAMAIKNPAACVAEIFYYSCVLRETLTSPLSKEQRDRLQQASGQMASEFSERFTLVYKAEELPLIRDQTELLQRHDSYDVWLFRNLKNEAAQRGITESQIDACKYLGSVRACNEYLRQEIKANMPENAVPSPFLDLASLEQSTLIDIQTFKRSNIKPFQISIAETVNSAKISDTIALARSLLFGLSVAILIHSFLYLLVLPRD